MHSKPAARPLMSNWFRSALFAAAFALAAPQAHAQPRQDLSGVWAFRAEFAAIGCTITGQATLQPTREAGRYDVRMIANEHCEGRDFVSRVEETCVAARSGAHVSVRCHVVDANITGYLPDDFELEIGGDGVMRGLLTANWNAPAEWRKLGPANVS